jgi:hypothetical protein
MRWMGVIVTILVLAVVAVVVVVVAAGCGDSESGSTPLGQSGPSGRQPRAGAPGGENGWRRRPEAYWTYDTLWRRLAGKPVRVGGRTVRIDPELVTCNGEGRGVGRPARWERFTCTQAIFKRRIAGDITFEVVVVGARRWRIVNARLGPD